MASPMLVTGGTGTLGAAGRPAAAARRLPRPRPQPAPSQSAEGGNKVAEGIELVTGNLATGEGIEAAVAGTEIVLHLAGSAKGDQVKAAHLVGAASPSSVVQLTYRPTGT